MLACAVLCHNRALASLQMWQVKVVRIGEDAYLRRNELNPGLYQGNRVSSVSVAVSPLKTKVIGVFKKFRLNLHIHGCSSVVILDLSLTSP